MSRSPSKGGSGTVTLTVRIQPRASKNGIVRMEDGSLKIRLTAPPVDGAANEALVKFLADLFSIAQSQSRSCPAIPPGENASGSAAGAKRT